MVARARYHRSPDRMNPCSHCKYQVHKKSLLSLKIRMSVVDFGLSSLLNWKKRENLGV